MTDTAKHTPGPWSVTDQHDFIFVHDKSGMAICHLFHADDAANPYREYNCEANAQLIAATPELLREAQNATQYLAKLAADRQGDFIGRSARGALRKLDAAIGKATQ